MEAAKRLATNGASVVGHPFVPYILALMALLRSL